MTYEEKLLFNSDGLVDENKYENIVVVLKDAYGTEKFDFFKYLNEGIKNPKDKTWCNLLKWIDGISELDKNLRVKDWSIIQNEYRNQPYVYKKQQVKKLGVVNLKKILSPTATTNNERLEEYTKRHSKFLKEEIKLLEPKLIIFGGNITFDLYKKYVKPMESYELINENRFGKIYNISGKSITVIVTHHPQATKSVEGGLVREQWYYGLMELYKSYLKSDKKITRRQFKCLKHI